MASTERPSNGQNGAPPPPPNFDDDWGDDESEDEYADVADSPVDVVDSPVQEPLAEEPQDAAPVTLAADETIVTRGGKEVTVPAESLHRGRL